MSSIPECAVAMLIRIANEEGLRGNEVNLYWIPSRTATEDEKGTAIIEYIERSATGARIR